MTVQTFYRLAVWLPLAVPGLAVILVHGLGVRQTGTSLDKILQLLLMSLVGGVPYAPIALWATFWIDSRPEEKIRRRAWYAPLWMIGTFFIFSVWLAVVSEQLVMALTFFVLGVIVILPLGYLYVILVFGLRESIFGPFTTGTSQP